MAKYIIEIDDEPFVPEGYDSDWNDSKYAKLYKAKDVDIVFTKDDLKCLTKINGLNDLSDMAVQTVADEDEYEYGYYDPDDDIFDMYLTEIDKNAELKAAVLNLAKVLNYGVE